MNDVQYLAEYFQPLLERLSTGQRAKLAKNIGRDLRKNQQKRITTQRNPDGSAYVPRRSRIREQKGKIKRKMFSKIKANAHLKLLSNSEAIAIGFISRVNRIANVHQHGLKDRATKNAPETVYSKRELLGFSHEDIKLTEESFIRHLKV